MAFISSKICSGVPDFDYPCGLLAPNEVLSPTVFLLPLTLVRFGEYHQFMFNETGTGYPASIKRTGRGRGVFSLTCSLMSACLFAAYGEQARRPIDVYDGFESATLSAVWSTERSLPGAITIQSQVVRSGRSAAAITLRPGDQLPDEKGSVLERAELMEARELTSCEDAAYSYSFSMFLPKDFPVLPVRLVIAQWKQYCPSDQCTLDNPVLALRYRSGELSVTLHVGPKTRALFSTRDEVRGKWLDFTFLIRFSQGDRGWVKASLNGREIADYTGPTAYTEAFGYPPSGRFFFKMGLYRDRTPETMTIYIDEYRKKELSGKDSKLALSSNPDNLVLEFCAKK